MSERLSPERLNEILIWLRHFGFQDYADLIGPEVRACWQDLADLRDPEKMVETPPVARLLHLHAVAVERAEEAEQTIAALRAEVARKDEALRRVEWSGLYTAGVGGGCVACHNCKEQGHRDDCWWVALVSPPSEAPVQSVTRYRRCQICGRESAYKDIQPGKEPTE